MSPTTKPVTCTLCGGEAQVVTDPDFVAVVGGARPGEVGVQVPITDEYTDCSQCGEQYYTSAQSQQHSDRVRAAMGKAPDERRIPRRRKS